MNILSSKKDIRTLDIKDVWVKKEATVKRGGGEKR